MKLKVLRGTRNEERGNGERRTGNGKSGTWNREPGTGIWKRVYSGNQPDNWGNVRKYYGSKCIGRPDIRLEYCFLYSPLFLERHATLPPRNGNSHPNNIPFYFVWELLAVCSKYQSHYSKMRMT